MERITRPCSSFSLGKHMSTLDHSHTFIPGKNVLIK